MNEVSGEEIQDAYKILLLALLLKKARLDPHNDDWGEVAINGVLYSIDIENGMPIITDHLYHVLRGLIVTGEICPRT